LKLFILILILSLAGTHAALAACYSKTEAEAEQGIRIHSELMVIGLNCQHMSARQGVNLYGQYRQFTARYADLISSYESVLLKFYKARGDKNPVATLNTIRTSFANKISDDAAQMRPDIFCATYAPRVTKAHAMNRDQVKKWAATMYPSHPVSYPLCASTN
jgi:hypothetical protein